MLHPSSLRMRSSLYLSTSFALGALASPSCAADPQTTCQSIAAALPNTVFLPDTPTYNASIASYPFVQLRLQPDCVIQPQTTHDVSAVVKKLQETGTKFALRGGGHHANVGFSNIEDGITIDMRSRNAVTMDSGFARVEAGAVWQDVYDAVEPFGVQVLGGRIGAVGVAGFLTGGGLSYFSPERGFATDYVANFEVVLANGEIVNANATCNTDLFIALKGGSSNFGIVTRFDLETFPQQDTLYGGIVAFAPEADQDLITAFSDFKLSDNYDPYAAGWISLSYNHTLRQVNPVSITWYTRPELAPGAFAGLEAVEPKIANGLTNGTVAQFARNFTESLNYDTTRVIWASVTFQISPTIIHKIYQYWRGEAESIATQYASANFGTEIAFQSIPPTNTDVRFVNSLGFPAAPTATDPDPRKLVLMSLVFYFTDASADAALNAALKRLTDQFNVLAAEEGLTEDYIYLNYGAPFQNPIAGYGADSVAELRRVATKYDPHGFFQTQLPGGYKVFY